MRKSRRPKTVKCRRCKGRIQVKPRGPLPVYCRSCRQRIYEAHRSGESKQVLLQTYADEKLRLLITAAVLRCFDRYLAEVGLPPWPKPPPAKKRAHLHLVTNDKTAKQKMQDDDTG